MLHRGSPWPTRTRRKTNRRCTAPKGPRSDDASPERSIRSRSRSAASRSSIAIYPHRKKIGGVHLSGALASGPSSRSSSTSATPGTRRPPTSSPRCSTSAAARSAPRAGAIRTARPRPSAPTYTTRRRARERGARRAGQAGHRCRRPGLSGSLLVQAGKLDDAIAEYKQRPGRSGIDGVLAREGLGLALEERRPKPRRTPPPARRASRTRSRRSGDAARRQGPAPRLRAVSPGPASSSCSARTPRRRPRSRRPRSRQGHRRARRARRRAPREPRARESQRARARSASRSLGARACCRPMPRHADAMSAEPSRAARRGSPVAQVEVRHRGSARPRSRRRSSRRRRSAADTLYVGSASGTFFALRVVDGTDALAQADRRGRVRAAGRRRRPVRRHQRRLPRSRSTRRPASEKWRYQSRGPIEQTPVDDRRSDHLLERGRSGRRDRRDHRQVQVAVQGRDARGVHAARPRRRRDRRRPALHRVLERHDGRAAQGHRLGRVVDLAQGRRRPVHGRRRDADRASAPRCTRRRRRAASTRSTRRPAWSAGACRSTTSSLPSSTGNVGGLATDGKLLYVSVADLGTYAIDLAGNIVWRVGAQAAAASPARRSCSRTC